MAVPKRKTSKMKIRSRHAANAFKGLQTSECSDCGAAKLPHRICPECGFYKGKLVVTAEEAAE